MWDLYCRMVFVLPAWWVLTLTTCPVMADGDWAEMADVGYTLLQTNLPGGRHANVRTMRAMIGSALAETPRAVAPELIDDPNAWTQFAGWSPDGRFAVVARGWQDPENAIWEEEHKMFRMGPGQWSLDSYLVDMSQGSRVNVTGIDRVSHYNAGLFFVAGEAQLGFTALINGTSQPFLMDRDGHHKHTVSSDPSGFAYGYSASPDGKRISYHENYQIYMADTDGTHRQQISTGNEFNFGPTWSPDGQWLLFLSGLRGACHPFVVRRDGSELRQLGDRNGYPGWILFLDVPDFHEGSSDVPVWSADGTSVFFTSKVGSCVELFQVTLQGQLTQLTQSAEETLHYHPTPSPDGRYLLYGSKRAGVRQLFAMNLAHRSERQITHLSTGQGAMWPHWRPSGAKP